MCRGFPKRSCANKGLKRDCDFILSSSRSSVASAVAFPGSGRLAFPFRRVEESPLFTKALARYVMTLGHAEALPSAPADARLDAIEKTLFHKIACRVLQ